MLNETLQDILCKSMMLIRVLEQEKTQHLKTSQIMISEDSMSNLMASLE